MKRILFLAAITGLLIATSGCSNGPLSGVIGTGNNCGNSCGSGLFGGSVVPTNFLKDGPVRQWLRGDACDSCNMPAGQISYDSGFDSSCESGYCGEVSSPVMSSPVSSGPIMSAPASNYYPSYNESLQPMSSVGPMEGIGGINESQFFGGASDSIELPPLSGN